jgi:hypothetical protein
VSLLSKSNCRSIAGALKNSSPVIPIIDLFGSSPGAGAKIAPRLLSEIGTYRFLCDLLFQQKP